MRTLARLALAGAISLVAISARAEGPADMHSTACVVASVNMGDATFVCHAGHTSWKFQESSRSDELGNIHKGQHVRVRWYLNSDDHSRTVDDLKVLH